MNRLKNIVKNFHPYILSNDSHKDAQKIPEWIAKWLKEKFLGNINSIQEKSPKKTMATFLSFLFIRFF